MQIEQVRPNKPNFGLVVTLSVVALLVFLVLAYFFVDFEGGSIHFRSHKTNPNAYLLEPSARQACLA